MPLDTPHRIGPPKTPTPIKILISLTVGLSLLSGFLISFAPHFIWNVLRLFALSAWGIKHFFVWQLGTYVLINPLYGPRFDLSFFISLIFNMYLLWIIGSSVIAAKGVKHFFYLYFGGALFSGLIALGFVFNYPLVFADVYPALYALLFAWMTLYPETRLLLFMTVPIKTRYLIVGLIAINLIIDLSSGDWMHFTTFLGGAAYGYFYSILIWERHSPFRILYRFEEVLFRLRKPFLPKAPSATIYDFKTGSRIDKDEAFMDACLEKISREGKKSLTWRERRRMAKITKKRR